jgi:hypothetical protein
MGGRRYASRSYLRAGLRANLTLHHEVRLSMKISCIVLIIIVALSVCPTLAQDGLSSGTALGQSAQYGSGNAPVQPFVPGPSSPGSYVGSPANSSVYTQTNPIQSAPIPLGQQYQTLSGPANAAAVQSDVPMQELGNRLIESTWYTRIDYFNWNERSDGEDFVNEYGTLITLGYMRRVGIERFHAALFGATMQYKGFGQMEDYSLEPLSSATGYLGALAEYDLHIEPDSLPTVSIFVGVGTRFWIRDLKDGITDYGNPSYGYQETWWTIYPYLGLEKKKSYGNSMEFYYSARIGCTAMTYEYATWGGVALYPKPGLTGQLEGGLRGRTAFISIFTETMSWGESDTVAGMLQPNSRMFTLGLKTGFCF